MGNECNLMAWYSKIANLFKKSEPPAQAAYDTRSYEYQPPMLTYGQMYRDQAHVHLAVNMVSQPAACGEPQVVLKGSNSPIIDHPFIELLENPNPTKSQFEFLEDTFSDFQIFGNAYWWLIGGPDGLPLEMWRLRPDRVKRIPATGDYVYWLDAVRIVFNPFEIMHMPAYSATDDFFGDSRLKAAEMEILSDYYMAKYQKDFFGKNLAVPAGIWLLPESLPDPKFKETKQEIIEMYGGQRRTAIARASIDGQEVKFVGAGLEQQDMQFKEGREFNRGVIFQDLGIPTGMLAESSTEAHARVAERRFNEGIYYYHHRLSSRVNKDIMPFYGVGQVFQFKDVRTVDVDVVERTNARNNPKTRGDDNGVQTQPGLRTSGYQGILKSDRWDSRAVYRAECEGQF
jgi:HK97 family phage portal protein